MSTDSIDFDRSVERLADRHADLLALDWRRRARLLASPSSVVADLIAWDARMFAAHGALHQLGKPAAHHMRRALAEPMSGGTAFALILYALERANVDTHADLRETGVAIAHSLPHLHAALISAIEWACPSPALERVVESLPLPLRFEALAARHRDMPQLVEPAFAALRHAVPTSEVLCAALRCLQFLGDAHRAQAGIHHLDHPDARLQGVAAETLLALAPVQQAAPAVATLLRLLHQDALSVREAAARCLSLHAAPDAWVTVLAEIATLRSTPGGIRLHLQALGWSGDIASVPRLVEHLDDPAHSRIAAASLSLMTGSDPVRDGWQGEAPGRAAVRSDADSALLPSADPDARLPWPSRAAFGARWSAMRGRFGPTGRWFAGHPVAPAALVSVLKTGPLAWRPLAAARLQRLSGHALFPTHLSAPKQLALFRTMLED